MSEPSTKIPVMLKLSDPPVQGPEVPGELVVVTPQSRSETARTAAIVGLFLLAFIAAIYFARSFVIPVVVALVIESLFRPAVRWLRKRGLSDFAGASIVMLGFVVVVGTAGYRLAAPAAEWSVKGPASLTQIEGKLRKLLRPLAQVQATAARVEEATKSNQTEDVVRIQTKSLFERVSGSMLSLFEGLLTSVLLAFFMLGAGDRFIQHTVELMPTFSDKKKAVRIARDIESQVSTYMVTVTLVSAGLGVATGVALALLGMPNASLWGFVAGLLNFIPYLGAIATVLVIGVAALATFDSPGHALLMPLAFFILHLIEANFVKPMILGRRLELNQTALFIGLFFWWYLWGTIGAMLAVPLLVAIKVFSDHVVVLHPLATFLGKDPVPVPVPTPVPEGRERLAG